MLLRDKDILDLVGDPSAVVPDITDKSLTKQSPVQPASLDLHIGHIYLPGTNPVAPGGVNMPHRSYALQPGETAVVETLEELKMPSDLAGISFPPAHVSAEGLLMTNPGHMDPGYQGTMRFTVINMGQEAHPLSQGKEIVTVLFFRLEEPAEKDWSARGGIRSSGVSGNTLSKLSRDFVDVDRRAADIAGKRARRVIVGYGLMAILLTLLTVIAAFAIAFLPIYFTTVEKTNDLQNDIRQLKERVGIDGASSSGSPAAPSSSTSTQSPTPSPPSTSAP